MPQAAQRPDAMVFMVSQCGQIHRLCLAAYSASSDFCFVTGLGGVIITGFLIGFGVGVGVGVGLGVGVTEWYRSSPGPDRYQVLP